MGAGHQVVRWVYQYCLFILPIEYQHGVLLDVALLSVKLSTQDPTHGLILALG
jgi:hypothetical protein